MYEYGSISLFFLGLAVAVGLEVVGCLYLVQLLLQLTQLSFRWLTNNPGNFVVTFGHKLLGVTGTSPCTTESHVIESRKVSLLDLQPLTQL